MPDNRRVVGRLVWVTLTGQNGQIEVPAKVDTGADRSNVGKEIADKIGVTPVSRRSKTRAGDAVDRRQIVSLSVEIQSIPNSERLVEPNIKDRSSYTGDFLIGVDLLEELELIVDPTVDTLG